MVFALYMADGPTDMTKLTVCFLHANETGNYVRRAEWLQQLTKYC